jgi:hypothetical protein
VGGGATERRKYNTRIKTDVRRYRTGILKRQMLGGAVQEF